MADQEGSRWSNLELAAAVAAYRKMEELHASGEPFTKTSFYNALEVRFGRDAGAFERRMQNISAVLERMGEPWLKGLAPARNVGPSVDGQLRKLLKPGGLPPYHAKLPAVRAWLIEVARRSTTATYGALMAAFSLDRFNLIAALGALGHESKQRREPILTALVVNQETGECSEGLENEFGVRDAAAERQKLYGYWLGAVTDPGVFVDTEPEADTLEDRASKFSRQAVRPEQAAFRKRVYVDFNEACAISGCNIRRTLDAAHIKGRSWHKGHNKAGDGLLLRKDLHALYDAGLLSVDKAGRVAISDSARSHYGDYHDALIATRRGK